MYIVVLVTASSKEEAVKISNGLLENKLAACVNILQGVSSFFWWEKKIDQANECLMIIKSKKSLLNKIIKKVKSLHSYQVPEIIALPIIGGIKSYLKWIDESVRRNS
ncbi:MAG: divalent-cation tolerance protein CutA [Candidatus Omnitrophica bacterium]|jgi:periplasmic divalent cation tolerance protein|nr:divalent-cation tolerance protein CutA [Candidatus Omnitrophota bacterium]